MFKDVFSQTLVLTLASCVYLTDMSNYAWSNYEYVL